MRFISYISVFMIPVLILYILGYGLIAKRNIYNDFLEGAEEGLKVFLNFLETYFQKHPGRLALHRNFFRWDW